MSFKNRLHELFAANKPGSRPGAYQPVPWQVYNADDKVAEVYIYEPIGAWYGIDAAHFVHQLKTITAPVIKTYFNTPGGDAFDGRAIANTYRRLEQETIAYIDGVAASAGSYIALANDRVIMGKGSRLMIHNAWSVAVGDARELRALAVELEGVDRDMLDDYFLASNQSREQIKTWMDETKFFSDEEAVEYGFAEAIEGQDDEKAKSLLANWDLSAYTNAPTPEDISPIVSVDTLTTRERAAKRLALLAA